MTFSLKSNVAKAHQSSFKMQKRHVVERGGRFSTKTYKNALRLIMNMLEDPRREWVIVRNNYKDHRTSTVRVVCNILESMGFKQGSNRHDIRRGKGDFYVSKTDLKIVLWTGQEIQFGAMNDVEKIKGFVPSSNDRYFAGVWFFEIAEFKNAEDMQTVLITFIREVKPSFNVLYEFNPHHLSTHWTVEWWKTMLARPDAQCMMSTYLDLTDWEIDNWIGREAIDEAEITKEYQPEVYNHMYLGMTRKLKGAIYKSFKVSEHVKTLELDANHYTVGVDYGQRDAVSAILEGFWGATHVHAFDQFYHKNSEEDHKTIVEYADMLDVQLEKWAKQVDRHLEVFIDSASLSFIELMEERALWSGKYTINAVDKRLTKYIEEYKDRKEDITAIQERIDFVELMFALNRMSIDPKCKQLIAELEMAEYGPTMARKDDSTHPVDSLDSFEYGHKEELPNIREWVINNEAKRQKVQD